MKLKSLLFFFFTLCFINLANAAALSNTSEAYYTNKQIAEWSKTITTHAFTMDYEHAHNQLNSLERHFTKQGWQEFRIAMAESGNIYALIQGKLHSTATIEEYPKIESTKVVDNAYQWIVTMPVDVVFADRNDKQVTEERLYVSLRIVRTTPEERLKGLAISQFIAHHDPVDIHSDHIEK
ncbi:MAG: DotI/IcmL family type IV secretion protein [Gammaproteobacteria bacterium]